MLFRRDDMRLPGTEQEAGIQLPATPAMGTTGDASFIVGRRGADLSQLVPALPPCWSADIISDGHWSLHEMIAYLLRITGPAHVWLTSWGISTEPLQALLDMVRSGMVKDLQLILSHRVVAQAPQAYQLLKALDAEDAVSTYLAKIHAKLLVIHNDRFELRVATSANLTRNPRIEQYNISTHREHALGTRSLLDLVRQGAQPFKNHVVARATEGD